MNPINMLPPEVWTDSILIELDWHSTAMARQVSRLWRDFVTDFLVYKWGTMSRSGWRPDPSHSLEERRISCLEHLSCAWSLRQKYLIPLMDFKSFGPRGVWISRSTRESLPLVFYTPVFDVLQRNKIDTADFPKLYRLLQIGEPVYKERLPIQSFLKICRARTEENFREIWFILNALVKADPSLTVAETIYCACDNLTIREHRVILQENPSVIFLQNPKVEHQQTFLVTQLQRLSSGSHFPKPELEEIYAFLRGVISHLPQHPAALKTFLSDCFDLEESNRLLSCIDVIIEELEKISFDFIKAVQQSVEKGHRFHPSLLSKLLEKGLVSVNIREERELQIQVERLRVFIEEDPDWVKGIEERVRNVVMFIQQLPDADLLYECFAVHAVHSFQMDRLSAYVNTVIHELKIREYDFATHVKRLIEKEKCLHPLLLEKLIEEELIDFDITSANGNNLLHSAVGKGDNWTAKALTTEWLLSLKELQVRWLIRQRNHRGERPLELARACFCPFDSFDAFIKLVQLTTPGGPIHVLRPPPPPE